MVQDHLKRTGNFNPRTHTECDRIRLILSSYALEISIHALTRSATSPMRKMKLIKQKFQSTHSHGVRRAPDTSATPPRGYFNPRTHTECDAYATDGAAMSQHFNPHTHTECDAGHRYICVGINISIHALTRSATSSSVRLTASSLAFQSTHSHGVRPHVRRRRRGDIEISIHALTRSATAKKSITYAFPVSIYYLFPNSILEKIYVHP